MKKIIYTIAFVFLLANTSCQKNQEARKPIANSSGSFMKQSVDRNKKLIAGEEAEIARVIRQNKRVKFIASTKGFWYSYIATNTKDTLTPKKGDVALFDYEVKDLKGRIIYSQSELGPQTYFVDKQNIMMGLRDGIKLMHRNEKINFLFTSPIAYGYHGDNKKIGTNKPLLCIVTLRDFMSEANYDQKMKANTTSDSTTQNDSIIN
ncbi:MAG: gliding motility-associated peptidyl-prolyl isomerase GldI [Flavobacterium sp.]|jgi:gliding motility-associated peptidyl-prolyl isomerase|nr:gliding motility-associated peptidyl-prolyl isomerase GldI [Flavobacterium sp.]